MNHYSVSAHSTASPTAIYRQLLVAATWPSWMPIDSIEVEGKPTTTELDDVGAIRIVRTGKHRNREQITHLEPDRRFQYHLLDGFLLDYHGDVALNPTSDGGTDIHWSATFRMALPGAGWFMQLYLKHFMQRAVDGLATFAAQRA